MTEPSNIILLPHPGRERLPARATRRVPWPTDPRHARKFLRAPRDWSLSTGYSGTSLLELWTEYEGPTIAERLDYDHALPKAVHEIDPNPGPPT